MKWVARAAGVSAVSFLLSVEACTLFAPMGGTDSLFFRMPIAMAVLTVGLFALYALMDSCGGLE